MQNLWIQKVNCIRKLLFIDFSFNVFSVCIMSSLVCLSGTSSPLSLLLPSHPQIACPVFLLGSQHCQPHCKVDFIIFPLLPFHHLPHPSPSSLPVLGLHKYKHMENVKNASKFGSLAAFCLEKYPQMVRTEAKQPQKQNATWRSVRTQLPLSLKTFLAGIPLSKCGGRADKTTV